MSEQVYRSYHIPATGDTEFDAMLFIKTVLKDLETEERRRVLAWLISYAEQFGLVSYE